MKKIQTSKRAKGNNPRSFFNYRDLRRRTNAVTPELPARQMWRQDDERAPVEIIELSSSDDHDISTDDQPNWSHVWSYVNNDRFQQSDDYRINKGARERRRLNLDRFRVPTTSVTNEDYFRDNNYANISRNRIDDNITLNQMNYFTIFNKHFMNSDTSTDEDAELDKSEYNNDYGANRSYDEEISNLDSNIDTETRTVWIYSFKNKRMLSENDFELVSITGKDTSSCSTSLESDDEICREKSTRVTTYPVSTYIPRLNLTLNPALPTVTEITESIEQPSSNEAKDSSKNRFQKPKNSWIIDSSEKSNKKPERDQSTNIVSWMALSPREKRRRTSDLTDIWKEPQGILKVMNPYDNLRRSNKMGKLHEKSTNIVNWMALSPREKRRRSNDFTDKWKGPHGILHLCDARPLLHGTERRVEVAADVHVSESAEIPKIRILRTSRSADTVRSSNQNVSDIIQRSDPEENDQGSGDHEVKCHPKPRIVLSNKRTINTASITDPIEKLDGNWIYEENCEKETACHNYSQDKVQSKSETTIEEIKETDKIWMKSTKGLMKPARWNEYLPITGTPVSLHLSLSSIVDEKQRSWFKKIARCIRCCK